MSIFGANHPLHLENDKYNILLKSDKAYCNNKNGFKRQNNLFIILQDGWWGLDFHRKLNQQNQYFQFAILISVKCLSSSFWWLSTKSVLKDHLGQHVFGDFEPLLFLICAGTRKKFLPERKFCIKFFFCIINVTGNLVAQL